MSMTHGDLDQLWRLWGGSDEDERRIQKMYPSAGWKAPDTRVWDAEQAKIDYERWRYRTNEGGNER